MFLNLFEVYLHVESIWLLCMHSKEMKPSLLILLTKFQKLLAFLKDVHYFNSPWLFCAFLLDLIPNLINLKGIKDKTAWLNNPRNTYIGRYNRTLGCQSIWHNPFKMTNESVSERVRVVWKYLYTIHQDEVLFNKIHELTGQTLGCWCTPELCHGDILIHLYKENLIFLGD